MLTAAAPIMCQEEERPYFALNSSRTFAPGETPSIILTTTNVADVAFRVYRINDPFKFFESLEDPHMFGGQAQRPPQRQTFIERFHTWKVRLRNQIRWDVRDQFTDKAWKDVRDFRHSPPENRSHGVTTFATTPVLNSQQLVATWQTHIGKSEAWHTATIPVEVAKEGVYLVEATRDDLRAFTIVMVSQIGIISKTTKGHVAGGVAKRSTGDPIPDCDILLITSKDAKTRLKTNSDGLFDQRITLPQGNEPQPLVLARSGASFAAGSLPGYSLMNRVDDYSGYAYTDRPVYRPGHAVSFKGILRVKQGNVNQIPPMKAISVEITGPEDKKFYQKSLDLDNFGALAGDLTLPNDAPLGTYSVNIHAADTLVGGTFEVKDYKKPEYEVRVTTSRQRVLEGDDIAVTIDAQYFFGEPVAGAKVEYVVHRSRYWDWGYYGEPDDNDQPVQIDYQGDTDEQVLDETAKLDANGKLEVKIPTDIDEHTNDMRYRIEARVTDEGNREITGTSFVLATFGSFRLRIDPERWFVPPGTAAGFNVSASDYDNRPIKTPVTVELIRYSWREKEHPVVTTANGQTDAQGNTRVPVTIPQEGGAYEVRVKAHTPEGRQVLATSWIISGGSDWGDMEGGEEHRVQLVPDQKHYAPGDTAHILIITGVKHARVLVSVEGASLSQLRIVEANGPSVSVDVPITSDSVPDIFVSASFFFENQFYNGTKMVKVPPNDRKLAVEIKSSKPQYTPGEGAQLTIDAKDAAGKPVSAEISLGVVDEAIYGIKPDSTPEGIQVFYGTQYNSVQTDSSLSYEFHGEAGKRRMQLAALRPHRSFSALKPDRLVMPKIRKAFPDTTLWLPRVMTDANGHAVANFSFPDSITAWRATARAITADTKVGGAVLKTIVRKNVILRLVTPRFFTMGDEVTISAIAHNYLAAKDAKMTLDVKGLEIIDPGPRQVTIDSKGEAKSDWRVRATAPGQATVTGAVLTNEESDAMELPVPVNPYGVKMTEAHSGIGAADVAMQFPAQSVPQSHVIEVSVSSSVAGAMFAALDYLTAFPYGCTEQTMSSFLPNVVVTRALKELNVSTDVNKELLAAKLKAGLDRLSDFQHEDGGWGWWKTDESAVFMTAYVDGGLSQAKAAGVEVNDDSIARGLKWLHVAYNKNPKMVADLKAYLVYAMAQTGKPDLVAMEDAWEFHEQLTPDGAAILGLAFEMLPAEARKPDRIATLVKQLESSVKTDEAHAWWFSERDFLMDYWFDTSSEATAMALKFLSHVKPDSPLLPKAVLYLMDHRQGYYWYSTKQTAMVIFGLTDYLKQSGELKPNLQATVTVNGKQVLAKAFGPADALSPVVQKVAVNAADLAADNAANKVHVSSTGSGRLYWSVTERYASTESRHVKEGSTDLNLLRDYYKLTPQKSGEEILYSLDKVDGPLAVGDVLAVRLTITGSVWRYLLVEDPIPAGAEFIERDDLYKLKDQPSWWHYYFDRRELHDDRMALFRSYFYNSQEQYFYLLKVVNPGKFRVSPAKVEPMYQPKYLATTEGKEIEFK